MIEPSSFEQAKKLLRLSGPTHLAALAWLDGYEGNDRSALYDNFERPFYQHSAQAFRALARGSFRDYQGA